MFNIIKKFLRNPMKGKKMSETQTLASDLASAKRVAAEAANHVKSLEKRLESLSVKPWMPKQDEKYYRAEKLAGNYLNCSQHITDEHASEGFGIYKYQKSAVNALKFGTLLFKLRRLAARMNKGWTPDWSDSEQKKYFLFYNHDEGRVSCNFADTFHRFGVVYFKNMSDAFAAYRSLTKEEKQTFRGL